MTIHRRGAARAIVLAGMLATTACVGTRENPVEPEPPDPSEPSEVRTPPGGGTEAPLPPSGPELRE